jgi:hypothetical protein
MPKKGKLPKAGKALQDSVEFIEARRRYSAVESAINALENHGLDRCSARGIAGFKSCVAIAVVARNIQQLGCVILDREGEAEQREGRRKEKRLVLAACWLIGVTNQARSTVSLCPSSETIMENSPLDRNRNRNLPGAQSTIALACVKPRRFACASSRNSDGYACGGNLLENFDLTPSEHSCDESLRTIQG